MDIAAVSMDLSLTKVQQSAGISIVKKAMSTQETEAAGLMEMMESAAPAQMASDGLGQVVDVRA